MNTWALIFWSVQWYMGLSEASGLQEAYGYRKDGSLAYAIGGGGDAL